MILIDSSSSGAASIDSTDLEEPGEDGTVCGGLSMSISMSSSPDLAYSVSFVLPELGAIGAGGGDFRDSFEDNTWAMARCRWNIEDKFAC